MRRDIQSAQAAVRWALIRRGGPQAAGIVRTTQLAARMRHRLRLLGASASIGATAGLLAASSGQALRPRAMQARVLNATDTAHLRYNARESEGSLLLEEGSASGALPGRMRARVNVGATFSGNFVLFTSGGSIKGRGSATPRGSGRYESFRGSLTLTGGTGRYAHVHGQAGLYGVFDRKSYSLTVQTTGRLSY